MIAWTDRAWNEYLHRQKHDKKVVKRINKLIQDIKRHPLKKVLANRKHFVLIYQENGRAELIRSIDWYIR
ncbi:type II toxin-antitoxin system YoeB family toxin [Desulfococcaceae bacterium HSG8]|nr:type II toxin-antitoxin system YoeB family toxin [Desulfococcaceae bacterium HSG8]